MTIVGGQHPKSYAEIDVDSAYSLVRFRQTLITATGNINLPAPKRIEVSGDHLTCVQVTGSAAIYVKLGTSRNPWVRLRRGMVLRRTFRQLYFVVYDNMINQLGVASTAYVEAICYASVGPLIEQPDLSPGVTAGFIAGRSAVSATANVTSLQSMIDLLNPVPANRPVTAGINGWLQLANTGSVSVDLTYVGDQSISLLWGTGGYRMLASPSPTCMLTLPLIGPLNAGRATDVNGSDIYFQGIGGAGEISFLWSPGEMDSTLPELFNSPDLSP